MCNTQHTVRSHLSQEDRVVLEALHGEHATLRAIARVIHKHYSTVSRELSRNTSGTPYTAKHAQKKCISRRFDAKRAARKIENDVTLSSTIEEKLRGTHLRGDWSPAVIAHTTTNVSHQTIYAWIRRSRPDLRKLLPRSGKYRRQYGSLKAPSRGWTTKIRSIETRPTDIEARATLGHYEADTVLYHPQRTSRST